MGLKGIRAPVPAHRQRLGATLTPPRGGPPDGCRARNPHPAARRTGRHTLIQSGYKPLAQIRRIRFPHPCRPLHGSQHESEITPDVNPKDSTRSRPTLALGIPSAIPPGHRPGHRPVGTVACARSVPPQAGAGPRYLPWPRSPFPNPAALRGRASRWRWKSRQGPGIVRLCRRRLRMARIAMSCASRAASSVGTCMRASRVRSSLDWRSSSARR